MNNMQNLVIFEMANNHQGDVDHALKIVEVYADLCKKYDFDGAIKLQFRDIPNFISKKQLKTKTNKHIDRFLSTNLTQEKFKIICNSIKEKNLKLIITPFDEKSVDNAVKQNVDILKIASCSASDWPLIEKIVSKKIDVIASTGGQNLENIDKLHSFLFHKNINFALMHCVSLYPTNIEEANLGFLYKLKLRYSNTMIGYSGHEKPDDLTTIACAVGSGAKIFERHVGLETDEIKLNGYSMNPKQCDKWLDTLNQSIKAIKGNNVKNMTNKELDSIQDLARGVFAKNNIKKGNKITNKDVYYAFPLESNQLSSGQFSNDMIATKNYKIDEKIYENLKIKQSVIIREFVHIYKGMFEEAKVTVGNYLNMELSHHYGIEYFREYGAILITIINNNYCKKLVGLLKCQKHPCHRHLKKNETFHVLYGDVKLIRNGIEHVLTKGDKIEIRAGDWHSFSSNEGAIFEEISSKSIVGDSQYKDKNINKFDPYERKSEIILW